eukprot:scaffold1043_cov117-Cylindrotheca_fusiformis.AAC.5
MEDNSDVWIASEEKEGKIPHAITMKFIPGSVDPSCFRLWVVIIYLMLSPLLVVVEEGQKTCLAKLTHCHCLAKLTHCQCPRVS